MARRLVIATRNPGKVKEISELLAGLPVEAVSLEAYADAPEVDEPFETFAENAAHKARSVAAFTGEWALADDSGLEVRALDGAPGVKSARVAPTDSDRIHWVLRELSNVPVGERFGRFVCALVLATPEGLERTWVGTVEGQITTGPRGDGGFGFDPVFHYPPAGRTFAEMSSAEKSKVSHRGAALKAFCCDFPGLLAEASE